MGPKETIVQTHYSAKNIAMQITIQLAFQNAIQLDIAIQLVNQYALQRTIKLTIDQFDFSCVLTQHKNWQRLLSATLQLQVAADGIPTFFFICVSCITKSALINVFSLKIVLTTSAVE